MNPTIALKLPTKMKTAFRLLFTILLFAAPEFPVAAQISTNKVFVVNTNNTIPPNETNFFDTNIVPLTNALARAGFSGSGGGGGGSGIAPFGGFGTNTYLTNATTSGQRATNLTIVSGNISGATNLPTSALTQSGASAGQVLEWNGTSWVPVSIASYVNITSVGGVGDGVTDNNTAISNAMAAAGNGGAIYFPRGKYKVSGNIVVTNANLTILGDGAGSWALGQPDTLVSAIVWSNLTANCFVEHGSYLTFQNIAGFWTNSTPPSAGAFVCVTTNADGVNGAVSCNWNNVLLDGGYRCVDYQAGQGWQAYNLTWIRWYYDGIRINNFANVDVGGWTILNSGWEAIGGIGGYHTSRCAIRWEGSGGGQILNSGGGAFNWGSYGDTGGYTNAIDVQPAFQSGAGSDTSGLFFNNCIIDNWGQNAVYTHAGTGNFSNLRMTAVQAESYVSGRGTPVSLTGGIGNAGLIDGLTVVSGGLPTGGYPVYLENMAGVAIGYVETGSPIAGTILNNGSTGVNVLPDGTGFYDPDKGMPQIREGGYFVQSQTNSSFSAFLNSYYNTSGLYYVTAGPAMSEDVYAYYNNEPLTWQMSFYPSNAAGTTLPWSSQTNTAVQFSPTQVGFLNMTKYAGFGGSVLYATNTGNVGIDTTTPAAALDVNGSAIVRGTFIAMGAVSGNGAGFTNQLFPFAWTGVSTTVNGLEYWPLNGAFASGSIGTLGSVVPQGVLGITNISFGTSAPNSTSWGNGTNVVFWMVTNGAIDYSRAWTNYGFSGTLYSGTNDSTTYKSLAGITNLFWAISNNVAGGISVRPSGAFSWVK